MAVPSKRNHLRCRLPGYCQNLNLEVLTADRKLARAPGIDVVVHDLRDANIIARLEAR